MSYALWDAAIAAGATLHDLWRMESGMYSTMFLAKVVAWHRGSESIKNHVEAAKAESIKKK